ncbi:methyltransferase-like protein 27 [Oculina patagonica]
MTPTDEKYHKQLQWLRENKDVTTDDVRRIYANWAAEYDKTVLHTIPYTSWKHIAHILDVAVLKAFPNKEKDEMKIIDVAAGTGLTGVELNKLGYTNIDALDMSQEMLNEAKKKNVYKRFICAPLTDQRILEIETGAYDALVCVNAIGNKHILQSAMAEMCRFVSKGGFLCFDIFEEDMTEWQGKLLELENVGILENVTKEKVPLYNIEGLQTETNVFVFKVLKN